MGAYDRIHAGPPIAVVGTGYVGTVVAACLASVGHRVVGLEVDADKLAALQEGRAPFYEPGLDALLQTGLGSGAFRFTSSIQDAMAATEVVFLCVGTPPGADGGADRRSRPTSTTGAASA